MKIEGFPIKIYDYETLKYVAYKTGEINNSGQSEEYFKRDKDLEVKKLQEISESVANYRAILEMDKDNNIIIKIMDSEGKIVRQIPPQEYIEMISAWKENVKAILHVEV